MDELKNHGKKWFYWLTIGIVLIIVYKTLDQFSNVTETIGDFFKVISPIILGTFIAYLLYIPSKKIENIYQKSKFSLIKKKARALSIFTVYIIAIVLIIIIVKTIFPVIAESTKELIGNVQGYTEIVIKSYQELPEDSILKRKEISEIVNGLRAIDIKQYVNLNSITEYAKSAIGFFSGIINTFVALIVSVYILSERDMIYNFTKKAAKAMFKENAYKNLSKYFNSANRIFLGFINSQIIDAVIVSILTTIAMCIMRIKYAPLLGFLIGLFNIIPYVGAIIAVILSAIITLITGGVSQAIWMIIVVTILQQIDAHIINPKIIGNSLKISPLLVIIAITIGGAYWGMFGIFVAVPISALIKIIAEDYIDYKMQKHG